MTNGCGQTGNMSVKKYIKGGVTITGGAIQLKSILKLLLQVVKFFKTGFQSTVQIYKIQSIT